jgi:hypothetical protein
MTPELWFHAIEIFIMLFGLAIPVIWGTIRLASLLKDFPPHRHINGTIIFPHGYEPVDTEKLAPKA